MWFKRMVSFRRERIVGNVNFIKCIGCKCKFQKEKLILHEQQCSQVVGEGTRHLRQIQVEDMILKLCKEVGYK